MLKKYPFIKQEGFKDCGCASMLMIIKYYKGNISIERLRDLTHTNKSGTSAYNIIRAFQELGFYSKGVKCGIDDLKSIVFPCISHVVIDSIKHYVVIYEINFLKEYIVIADPARGIRKISFNDFISIWSGVLIVMYPVRNVPIYKSISISSFISKNIVNNKSNLIILFFLSLFSILLKLVSSFYFKFIIEGIDISRNYLRIICIIFLLLSLTKLVINYLRSKFLIIINSRLDFSLVLDAFKRIISLPYRYYHNRSTGEIVSKINDLSVSRDFISKVCVLLFIDFPLIIISIIFLIKINFRLFLITLIPFVLYLFLTIIYSRVFDYYISKVKNYKERVNSYMYESINGFETVKGLNIESRVIDRFNNIYISFLNGMFKLNNHVNNQAFMKDLINEIGNIFILFIGSLLVYEHKFSIGYLITYSSMMVYFLEPIRNIIDMDFNVKESKESITRVLSLYENYSDKGIINFKDGNICFKNLSFTFDNRKDILKGVNVSINKGEKVMIYGTSGSGKSTLLKLLMGYYSVDRGMIFIDNIDINDYKVKSLRKNITYVSQNEVLFNDTLINNLKLKCRDNDRILSMTRLLEFNEILDNDLGLNMMVEENGFNLSGGQRQRIVLARALLGQAQIILIDEGLSQVDVSLERKILINIFNEFKDKTFIIISHRMENLDLFDKFIKVENGEVFCEEG
ncbi:MAG: peptidase domain-containing ABC transporter [Bacilli bacterium]